MYCTYSRILGGAPQNQKRQRPSFIVPSAGAKVPVPKEHDTTNTHSLGKEAMKAYGDNNEIVATVKDHHDEKREDEENDDLVLEEGNGDKVTVKVEDFSDCRCRKGFRCDEEREEQDLSFASSCGYGNVRCCGKNNDEEVVLQAVLLHRKRQAASITPVRPIDLPVAVVPTPADDVDQETEPKPQQQKPQPQQQQKLKPKRQKQQQQQQQQKLEPKQQKPQQQQQQKSKPKWQKPQQQQQQQKPLKLQQQKPQQNPQRQQEAMIKTQKISDRTEIEVTEVKMESPLQPDIPAPVYVPEGIALDRDPHDRRQHHLVTLLRQQQRMKERARRVNLSQTYVGRMQLAAEDAMRDMANMLGWSN